MTMIVKHLEWMLSNLWGKPRAALEPVAGLPISVTVDPPKIAFYLPCSIPAESEETNPRGTRGHSKTFPVPMPPDDHRAQRTQRSRFARPLAGCLWGREHGDRLDALGQRKLIGVADSIFTLLKRTGT